MPVKFERLFTHVADCVLISRPGGGILRANPSACAAFGRSEEELQHIDRAELFVSSDDLGRLLAHRDRGHAITGEMTLRRADGTTFPAEFTSAIVPLDDESLVYVIFRDISERRASEQQLALSAARFRAFFDGLHEAVCLLAPKLDARGDISTWVVSEANSAMHTLTSRTYLRGVTLHDLLGDRAVERTERMTQVHLTGEPIEYDSHFGERTITVRAFRMVDGLVGMTLLDVTEQRRAQRALSDTLARFDAFMSASPALKWVKTADDRLLYVNTAFQQAHGVTFNEAVALRECDLRPAEVRQQLRADDAGVLATGIPITTIEPQPALDDVGIRWWQTVRFRFEDASGVSLLGGTAFDVTSQKLAEQALRISEALAKRAQEDLERALEVTRRTEEQFRQSQKMEAVGRLAGGIAHDFNNLLTVILGNGEMLAQRLENDPRLEEVEEIREAGQRAAALTRQLLAFSRRQVLAPSVLNINKVVVGMEQMLRRLVGEDIDLLLSLHPSPHLCHVDAGQIEQVILNLVVNARDAMPDGGHLSIETANVVLDERYVELHPSARLGPHVMLSVSDSGVGMTREVQARLFEPFFTTKAHGRGTGLGLSTVHGIVHQSGGNVWVYSEPGHGSSFKIYLPRSASSSETELPAPLVIGDVSGTETILVVEDDAQVRSTVAGMLRGVGYDVLQASNGGEALALVDAFAGPIPLLLTDIVMPKMNGRQLAERLRQVRPDLEVIFMSGYTENVVVHHGVVDAGLDFLQKPLTRDLLLPKVREVLDRRRPQ
jgi:PAS domain S-box-containing protein